MQKIFAKTQYPPAKLSGERPRCPQKEYGTPKGAEKWGNEHLSVTETFCQGQA